MTDDTYKEMFNSLIEKLEKRPENTNIKQILELLIQKKSDYDLAKLNGEKEIFINNQNNSFHYCMQELFFRNQFELFSKNYISSPLINVPKLLPSNNGDNFK
jgi:hypothetical protein